MWNPGRRPVRRRPGFSLKWIFAAAGGAVPLIWLTAFVFSDRLPSEEMRDAREALSVAESAGAATWSPELYAEARVAWDSALAHLEANSGGAWPYRSYDSVTAHAVRAESLAAAATTAAREREQAEVSRLAAQRDSLEARLTELGGIARTYPSREPMARLVTEASRLLAQADGASRKGNTLRVAELSDAARAATGRAEARHQRVQDSLSTEAEDWRVKFRSMVVAGTYPFLAVDKRARRLIIVTSSDRADTLDVELGPEWLGDKLREGDRRTPEGLYRVSRKLGAGQTRYHRALLLDYPNREDRERFARNKRIGLLHASDRIGGLIEIHGGGGRDGDWTDGCVALPDREMERLFARIPLHTPVLIAPAL